MNREPILSIENLSKSYGRLKVLDSVSFDLHPGSLVALLGANGAGKTTTFRCILGVTDFRGRISVAGKPVKKSGKAVRRLIGYLPQTPGFSDDDSCTEALRFLADLRGVRADRIEGLLARVNLTEQKDVPVRQLSGGMRQRLALAAALLSDPPLLLLDEPTANLDVQSRAELHDLLVQLKEEGRTIVLSTHFVDHITEIADRVILLKDGRVELDEAMSTLLEQAGRRVTVHLNGTAPEEFLSALRSVGISGGNVTPAPTDLQTAITRRLSAEGSDEEEEAR